MSISQIPPAARAAGDRVFAGLRELLVEGDTAILWWIGAQTVVTSRYQVSAYNPAGRYDSSEGRFNAPDLPFALYDAIDDLREAMYRPGEGTWFSASLRVDAAGASSAEFDYDGEPEWDVAPDPEVYVADLERFPRNEAHIPPWLAARLAQVGSPP